MMSEREGRKQVLQIQNLSKSFGKIEAVKNIGFSVYEGDLFAFLGVNGAGKSTTISMICGQLCPDGGEIRIDGKLPQEDPIGIKSTLGVVFQGSALDRSLTARDNLKSRGALYGIRGEAMEKRLSELTELLKMDGLLDRPLSRLSGGQRRKIDIARALLHRPRILILDEPTTGLDPQTRRNIWEVIESLRKRDGMTVFLTTHYMEEAAESDCIVIIDHGEIVAEGTPLELKNRYTGDYILLYGDNEEALSKLEIPHEPIPDGVRIPVANTARATELISAHPEIFVDYEVIKGKMDDVFLAVTGKSLRQEQAASDVSDNKGKKGGRK